MDLVTRKQWNARAPRGSYLTVSATRGVKVHYTGGYVSPQIVDDHDVCVRLVQAYQRMHMEGGREQPYMDLGYNLVACPHRKVFMGRGPKRIPAANGAGLNTHHYAILGLIGSSGFTKPNDGLLHALRDGIEYLREHGDAGNEIKGHRDGYSTSCPGDALYAWVKRGAPRPKSATPAKPAKPKPDPADYPMEAIVQKLPHLKIGDGKKDDDPLKWDVKTLHHLLLARDCANLDGVDDTEYTRAHADGVKAIQQDAGLNETGRPDPKTWAALLRVL